MENEVVRRRMNKIAAHFTSDDVISSGTHLLPMNCSSGLYSVNRRCDNKLYFARQGSDSQACFMRQISSEKQSSCDASEGPMFSRPGAPPKCLGSASETPMFSRPSSVNSNYPNFPHVRPEAQEYKPSADDVPKFAKIDSRIGEQRCSNGSGWSPRMGVSEVGRSYVVSIEIPGVGIKDIRVEVDDHKLRVRGKRWTVEGGFGYQRRQCGGDPYQVVWPLPAGVNKDFVSAQYLDGVLQIVIPKL